MKSVVLASTVAILSATVVNAQDIEQVKKTIDAEKYSEARKSLKSMISSSPDKGRNYFYLGQVYLDLDKQIVQNWHQPRRESRIFLLDQ